MAAELIIYTAAGNAASEAELRQMVIVSSSAAKIRVLVAPRRAPRAASVRRSSLAQNHSALYSEHTLQS
ncbi:hypothetical protein V496_07310 [Pseudogymnoascus sp. VKM F-4515 (FW-2607)]|nr:hypothetical protein V496_07310 [Pseudogymnoascus sp. VKM F-4515 (FW-2607)]KFY98299.1 hypothetical protein V498_01564 [Pseudogymnoascus sp. VKM F-4517 (FW-2822)]